MQTIEKQVKREKAWRRVTAKVIKTIKKANKGFATAAVLLSTIGALGYGCGRTNLNQAKVEDICSANPSCCTENATTIVLNRKTDRKVASVPELDKEPKGAIISEPLIDFVNETHALATEGMPANMKITKVEEICVAGDLSAYAIKNGIYVKRPVTLFGKSFADGVLKPQELLYDAFTVFHESGHVQDHATNRPSSEVISQLNVLEQHLMGFVVFSTQKNSQSESIHWLGKYANHCDGLILDSLLFPIIHIGSGQFSYEKYFGYYEQPVLFILRRLLETHGDFGAIRQEISGLSQSEIKNFIFKQAKDFVEKQLNSTHGKYLSIDFGLSLKIVFFKELQRRFGRATAMEYFSAGSQISPHGDINVGKYIFKSRLVNSSKILVVGLGGLNCVSTNFFNPTGSYPCGVMKDHCDIVKGLAIYRDFGEGKYCCVSTDGQRFRKWVVSSKLDVHYDISGQPVTMNGAQWDAVVFNQITKKEEISLSGHCR